MGDQFIPLEDLGERSSAVDTDILHIKSSGNIDSKISVTNFLKSVLESVRSTITATVRVKTDVIDENTAAAGVTIDGSLVKDGDMKLDTVSEKTAAAGVTVDGLLIKDSGVGQTLIIQGSSAPTKGKTVTHRYGTGSGTSNNWFDEFSPFLTIGVEVNCSGVLERGGLDYDIAYMEKLSSSSIEVKGVVKGVNYTASLTFVDGDATVIKGTLSI